MYWSRTLVHLGAYPSCKKNKFQKEWWIICIRKYLNQKGDKNHCQKFHLKLWKFYIFQTICTYLSVVLCSIVIKEKLHYRINSTLIFKGFQILKCLSFVPFSKKSIVKNDTSINFLLQNFSVKFSFLKDWKLINNQNSRDDD